MRYSANHGLLTGEAAQGDVRGRIRATAVPGLILLASVPIALLSATAAELSWALIFFLHPAVIGRVRR